MQAFSEVVGEVELGCYELLKHFSHSSVPKKEMPKDLPPAAQRVWKAAEILMEEIRKQDFQDML